MDKKERNEQSLNIERASGAQKFNPAGANPKTNGEHHSQI